MQVTLEHVIQEAPHIATFRFSAEQPLEYVAGQFVELTVPHDAPDDRGTRRWFTLSSSPTQKHLDITTKFTPESSSYKRALQALQPGDTADMSAAQGDFVLPLDATRPLIFIAAGIGVTPFHSMLDWLVDKGERRDIKFMYGVSSESDIIFQDTFACAGQHATIVVKRPSPAWSGERGPLTAPMILGVEQPSQESLLFVSGPEQIVETLVADLRGHGISQDQIVTDYFQGYIAD